MLELFEFELDLDSSSDEDSDGESLLSSESLSLLDSSESSESDSTCFLGGTFRPLAADALLADYWLRALEATEKDCFEVDTDWEAELLESSSESLPLESSTVMVGCLF